MNAIRFHYRMSWWKFWKVCPIIARGGPNRSRIVLFVAHVNARETLGVALWKSVGDDSGPVVTLIGKDPEDTKFWGLSWQRCCAGKLSRSAVVWQDEGLVEQTMMRQGGKMTQAIFFVPFRTKGRGHGCCGVWVTFCGKSYFDPSVRLLGGGFNWSSDTGQRIGKEDLAESDIYMDCKGLICLRKKPIAWGVFCSLETYCCMGGGLTEGGHWGGVWRGIGKSRIVKIQKLESRITVQTSEKGFPESDWFHWEEPNCLREPETWMSLIFSQESFFHWAGGELHKELSQTQN